MLAKVAGTSTVDRLMSASKASIEERRLSVAAIVDEEVGEITLPIELKVPSTDVDNEANMPVIFCTVFVSWFTMVERAESRL
jgi:hypothetical protein